MPQNRWAGSGKNWSEKSLVSKALKEAQGGHVGKKSKSEAQTSQTPNNVLDAVTPWRLIPYVEQLERKQTEMVSVITRLQKAAITFNMSSTVSTSLQKSSGQKRPRTDHKDVTRTETETREEESLPSWLRDSITKGALICPIESIMPVPFGTELKYRNKARFTIGFDTDNKPCVGYKVGSYSEKQRIASPIGSTNLPHEIFTTLDRLQKWLQESPLPMYDQVTHTGVWREVSVRWSEKTGEIMVDLMANPSSSSSSSSSSSAASALTTSNDSSAIVAISENNSDSDIYKIELSRFVDCIKTLQGVGKIISVHICLQEYSGVSSPEASHPHKYLYGEKFVIEKMCGLSFAVSPGAFFQVHTPAAERLYFLARALAIEGVKGGLTYLSSQPSKREDLTILDVCCGTGTIGLVCAPFVGRVIGVDIAKEAIEDAERNKALNGETVSNAEFICGKAETLMKEIIKDAQNGRIDGKAVKEIVAIVDPPRAGLHPDVIRALRTCKLLKRVIYVSCNPTGSLAQDALKLCVPPRKGTSYASGPPFHPVHAYPFDLFPETQHCEMVMVFERGGGGVGGVEEEEKEEKREIEEKEEKREIFEGKDKEEKEEKKDL